ncbi:protein Lines homolog 1 isoform X1 [Gymnodraco acuticeps]|uniref:Protein Lines homolog 1 isoform X1 n=1 Tax=Gymnodraco acuticeps TaxID=8218 RepID=A0A6P8T6G6_GYMAC|nr:protein Lines homolog 1 isoform X1 [Gymnodraco acuticeps]
MEPTASKEPGPVRERRACLTEAYTCLRRGSCPSQRAHDVASAIFVGVCGGVSSGDRESCPPENHSDPTVELSCISMSLLEKISSALMSGSLPPAATLYHAEVLTGLQDMDLMLQLILNFQSDDQIISHLAAKSVSTCVFYQLHTSSTVCPVWQQKCVQAFYSSTPSPALDNCLWSITDVFKRLLQGGHQENIAKLLAAFDSSLMAICSKFLPEERSEVLLCLDDVRRSRRWGTTLCLLLELLELLTASSVIYAADVCLQSQRITYTHSSALLTIIGGSSHYFVKKRALLLLKRAVLQKSGEDWALGEGLYFGPKNKHLLADMSTLAKSMLTAVATNWLQRVQVESSSFFGGTRHVRGKEGKADCVMLRALGLLLLKSLELYIQTPSGAAGVNSAFEVCGYLQSVWGFLRQGSLLRTEVTHCCCWLSLLFGEQDDDMMEAAKALFSIFLHHRLCSGLDDCSMLKAACVFGCNPHCHFLLLLQSISFDHSILLDFLISTETCFLEYFVRYLKYLRADWQGFTAACGKTSLLDHHLSLQQSPTALCGGDVLKVTNRDQDPYRSNTCFQHTGAISSAGMISMAAGFHLVEYDSSDESDTEEMEVSQGAPVASVSEKSRFSALDMKLQKLSDLTGILIEPNTTPHRRAEGPQVPVFLSEQTSCPNMAPVSGHVTCDTLARVVLCMSHLREVVKRLHTKKLFPYNPSSLLRLLEQL